MSRSPGNVEVLQPTRWETTLFIFKIFAFRLRRLAVDLMEGPRQLPLATSQFSGIVAGSRTPLWSDTRAAERAMQLGKVQNLRVAARSLDGAMIAPDTTFSFWKQIGSPSRVRGFVAGRMLQQGCMVRSTGGGLCQLSNALYDVALQSDCEIVERHAHSQPVSGSFAARGRDATVAWNYVDLRFRASKFLQLRVQITGDELVVRLMGGVSANSRSPETFTKTIVGKTELPETCGTCGETSCFRHEQGHALLTGRTAYLVDEAWPEFVDYVASQRRTQDSLGMPMNGARWGVSRYGWNTSGFRDVASAPDVVLRRGLATRRLAQQGAARQMAQFRAAEAMAGRLARMLTPDGTEVVVAQSLLPFLWRDGHLGGRRFRVLMTRLPIVELQHRLDAAALAHPDRPTLADFRAPDEIATWESEALAAANSIVTPHAEIAALFADRAVVLEWRMPVRRKRQLAKSDRVRIAFPGPTVARKGAFEIREAARILDIEIVPLGHELEGGDFWSGVRIGKPEPSDWLAGIDAVVQPALIEERPQRLLAALAADIPVVATTACGLSARSGLTLVRAGDAAALGAAIKALSSARGSVG